MFRTDILRPKLAWWAQAARERRKYRGRFYRWASALHRRFISLKKG